MFAATTSPWYLPTWVSGQMPVTSPIAHRRSPARRCASTGIPCGSASMPTVSRPMPSTPRAPAGGDEQAVAAQLAAVARARGRSRRPRAARPVACTPRTSSMPSRRRTSPSASPSGAGSRASTCARALDERDLAAEAAHDLRQLDADRPAAEDEQPARDGLHAGRLAVAPDAVELAQARDRRDDRVGAGRHARRGRRCGGRRRPRPRPGRRAGRCRAAGRCRCPPASAPARRRSSRRP